MHYSLYFNPLSDNIQAFASIQHDAAFTKVILILVYCASNGCQACLSNGVRHLVPPRYGTDSGVNYQSLL